MKPFFLTAITIFWCACKYQSGNPQNNITHDTTFIIRDTISNAILDESDSAENDPDSVKIPFAELQDTLIYGKTQFAKIETYYPSLTGMYPENPEKAFAQTAVERKLARKEGVNGLSTFSSEVGIDEYYMLYAYFLKKRNGERRYRQERTTLRQIFRAINSIHFRLEHGGTYFGHMLRRVEGYAEYGVYQYIEYPDAYKKAYPVEEQKRLFLASLKQFVSDEAEFDSDLRNAYKAEREKDIFSFVEQLNLLISNNFYLHQAEQFEYTNYR